VLVQVHPREQPVLGEHVIADHKPPLLPREPDRPLLSIAAEQEEDLRLKRISPDILVEVGQEWVLLHDFKQLDRVKARPQQARERRFPYPDRPLHRHTDTPASNVSGEQPALGGPRRREAQAGRHQASTRRTS